MGKITKTNTSQLARELQSQLGLPHELSAEILDLIFGERERAGLIAQALARGERVSIGGFGTFSPLRRPPRRMHNPRTGKTVRIEPEPAVAFRASPRLRRQVAPYEQSSPGMSGDGA